MGEVPTDPWAVGLNYMLRGKGDREKGLPMGGGECKVK